MHSVLFVCMGNICRSPTAHGVILHKLQQAGLAERVCVDSAGTHGYHVGEPPDLRAQAHARQRGYDLSGLRARAVERADFARFDWILAMDRANLALLQERCPPAYRARLGLLTQHCRQHRTLDVPDPYYGGAQGFEQVLDLVEDACSTLVALYQDLPD